ncbi:unnamed protein product, partial [Callosobruchus maculatus]
TQPLSRRAIRVCYRAVAQPPITRQCQGHGPSPALGHLCDGPAVGRGPHPLLRAHRRMSQGPATPAPFHPHPHQQQRPHDHLPGRPQGHRASDVQQRTVYGWTIHASRVLRPMGTISARLFEDMRKGPVLVRAPTPSELWTKKGYDLAYKACACKCGRGHLKKDLDWMPPPPTSNIFGRVEEVDVGKKKKRRNKQNKLVLSQPIGNEMNSRARAGSLSCSSTGSSSPPTSGSEPSVSPVHHGNHTMQHSKKKTKMELPERIRVGGGANGIFTRRQDFSSFNALPKNKLNSYQIK